MPPLFDFLVMVLTGMTLLRLAGSLPWQNIIALAVCLLFFGAVLEWKLASRFFDLSVWLRPVLWLGVLLVARDWAKIILLSWRNNSLYGVWLILLASGLATLAYFFLGEGNLARLAIRFGAALISLTVIVPWLIQKKPKPGKI